MKNLFVILLISVFNISCASHKVDQQEVLIQVSKKRCLGKCPVYDLYLYQNGEVVFNGIDNVNKLGKTKIKVTKSRLEDIKVLLQKINWDTLQTSDRRKRDMAITRIKYSDKDISFQGIISKEVDSLIKTLEKLVL